MQTGAFVTIVPAGGSFAGGAARGGARSPGSNRAIGIHLDHGLERSPRPAKSLSSGQRRSACQRYVFCRDRVPPSENAAIARGNCLLSPLRPSIKRPAFVNLWPDCLYGGWRTSPATAVFNCSARDNWASSFRGKFGVKGLGMSRSAGESRG